MSKKSDLIENLLYSDNTDFSVDTKYEQFIIELMVETGMTLRSALIFDISMNVIPIFDVEATVKSGILFDVVDYLESKTQNLNKVAYLMGVFIGTFPDLKLTPL